MIKRLKNDIKDLVTLLNLRYTFCSSDFYKNNFRLDIVERIDSEIRNILSDLFTAYEVNKGNREMFELLFWEVLSENQSWKDCFKEFGEDFNFSEEMLKEMVSEVSI